MGGADNEQERKCEHWRHEDAEQKFDDEMAMENCNNRQFAMEGGRHYRV